MVDVIPDRVKRIWDEWNIRGILFFSLSLQIFLIFLAPLRKATGKRVIVILVWSSYLLADWSASFGVGLITAIQGRRSQPTEANTDLLAFWAPFLILHLGGPDAISALALEDNELWLRHLLNLISQVGAAIYVFALSLPENKIWIPTVLMFFAGVIKYAERTRALFLASTDKFRASMVVEPAGKLDSNKIYGCAIKKAEALERNINEDDLDDDVQVVKKAHQCFNNFKVLLVDLVLSSEQRRDSRGFFRSLEPETALRILEVELNFMFDVLYTKVRVIKSMTGYILRAVAFGAVLASLGLFHFGMVVVSHNGGFKFNRFDVRVTYTLLLGAVALDLIAFFKLIFSDWTLVSLLDVTKDKDNREGEGASSSTAAELQGGNISWGKKLKCQFLPFLVFFLRYKRPWWRLSPCLEDGHARHRVLATPILIRRWSGSISRCNLIEFSLKSYPQRIHEFTGWSQVVIKLILKWSGIEFLYGTFYSIYSKTIKDTINRFPKMVSESAKKIWYRIGFRGRKRGRSSGKIVMSSFSILDYIWNKNISIDRLTLELWKFIFQELKRRSDSEDDPETTKRISSARGGWILDDTNTCIPKEYRELLKQQFVNAVKYDESLLLWHFATEVCYNKDKEKVMHCAPPGQGQETSKSNDYREFSKMLSDYMIYLLTMQPTMIPASIGIGKMRWDDTCAAVHSFSKGHRVKLDPGFYDAILSHCADIRSDEKYGKHDKSVLGNAGLLARTLIKMEKKNPEVDKWELVSKMWVELMSYAAVHCKAHTHAQQLSKGGELITFVWLLMAHFGFGDGIFDEEGAS